MVFKDKTILQILEKYRPIWALGYLGAVANWDLETYMPVKGAKARGEALAKVSSLGQKLFLDKDFVTLIHKAQEIEGLNGPEKGVVRILGRNLKYYEKIPADFIEKFQRLTSEATVVWRQAKETNNFKLFEPYLEKIFSAARQKADYLGYKESPYDALLDEYEEGLTSEAVSGLFREVKAPLSNLLNQITNSKVKIKKLTKIKGQNLKILKLLGADFARFRLDSSAHPFTTSFGINDTRITGSDALSVIHEFGHALYDLQSDPALEYSPIAGGSSLVIHESQSRFWENFVGRSPKMAEFLKVNYQSLNVVTPGPIRVEADEVTYHFHIMLRFEIEKDLLAGKIQVKDLPEIWNTKMKEFLGIVPKNNSEGVLQDIHWSGGMVGYFPTYSFGTFLSGIWRERLLNEIEVADYTQIKEWLGKHIHQYGSTYTLGDLLKKNHLKFSSKPYLTYLQKKYSEIYHI